MPFVSEKQRRWMWANDPEMAQEFADATPKGAKLPNRVRAKVKNRRSVPGRFSALDPSRTLTLRKQVAKLVRKQTMLSHAQSVAHGWSFEGGPDLTPIHAQLLALLMLAAAAGVGRAYDDVQKLKVEPNFDAGMKLGFVSGQQVPVSIPASLTEVSAQDAVVAAQALGQLHGYSALGVQVVQLIPEASCVSCQVLAQRPVSIADAVHMVPTHSGCRCAWKPVVGVANSADQARDDHGRWVAAIAWAAKNPGKAEHVAKAWVADGCAKAVLKLPEAMQHAVNLTFHAAKLATATTFVTWTAGQAMAERVAKERGFTDEQAKRLRGVLSAVDVLAVKPIAIGAGAVLSPAVTGAVTMLPPATAAYLAYSTARDPMATWRAVRGVVPKQSLRDIHTGAITNVSIGDRIADVLGPDFDDEDVARFLAKLDATGDVEQALKAVTTNLAPWQAEKLHPWIAEATKHVEVGDGAYAGRFAGDATAAMSGVMQEMRDSISDALRQHRDVDDVTDDIQEAIERAEMRAGRTTSWFSAKEEVESQLDEHQASGVSSVMAVLETAEDDRVCEECAALDGQEFTVEEARGMLPLHVGCRCRWADAPIVNVQERDEQGRFVAVSEHLKGLVGSGSVKGVSKAVGFDAAKTLQSMEQSGHAVSGPAGYMLTKKGRAGSNGVDALVDHIKAVDKVHDAGGLVHLGDLHAASGLTREAFLSTLQEARKQGKVTLSAAEGRHGASEHDRASGIEEHGHLQLYASVRNVCMPFPVAGEQWIRMELDEPSIRAAATPEVVTLKDLYATQQYLGTGTSTGPLLVVQAFDKLLIFDGHHRAAEALAEGKQSLPALVYVYNEEARDYHGRWTEIGAEAHAAADESSHEVAKALGGKVEEKVVSASGQADKKPFDVRAKIGGVTHDVEVKTLLTRGDNSLSVHPDAELRKVAHLEDNPTHVFHTVAIDKRGEYQDGVHNANYSGNRMYYSRGIAKSLAQMHPVKSAAELKRLVAASNEELPAKAQGEMPKRDAELETKAAAAKEARAVRDRTRKAANADKLREQARANYARKKAAERRGE